MIEWLAAAIGVIGAILGAVLGRWWGRAEGKREGEKEAIGDAIMDKDRRLGLGRDAVRDGRGVGDPADRLRRNDGLW